MNSFELKTYDLYSRYLNPANNSENIVIVKVDQQSIDSLNSQGITWPWPRQIYAPIIEYLSEADAIFIDVLFTEPSSYGHEDDTILSESINKASNVYLPVFLSLKKREISSDDKGFIERVAIKENVPTDLEYLSAITPVEPLKSSVVGSGNVAIAPDSDGVYRRMPLFFKLTQDTIPHFIMGFLIQKGIVNIKSGNIFVEDSKVPLLDGRLLLRYSRSQVPFIEFSASEILKSYLDSNSSIPAQINKDFFKDRIVLIGLTAAGLFDLKPTTVASISTGVFIHATTLENIMNKNFIRPVPSIFVVIFILLISLVIVFAVLRSHSLLRNLSIFLFSFLVIILFTALLFKMSIYFSVIPPALSLVLSFILAVAYSYATEGKQRQFLKRTFLQYMDKKVVDYLLQNPSLIKPGGKNKRVTVFFADIAGFTTIAEKTPPEEVASMLHRILNSLTEVIISKDGVIDKYIGDCVMAFWGAPLDSDKDELNACCASIECIESIHEINKDFKSKGISEIEIRIGIHSGEAIAGNLGSDRIFHYTVIGDTVNLASRLESVNKFFGTNIIVSEETINRTDNLFVARELGLIAVKGKSLPIKIYELIGEEGRIDSEKREKLSLYNQGLSMYYCGNWHDAIDIFNKLLKVDAKDGPSEFYKKRCENLVSSPDLTQDWNVIKFTEK